MYESMLKSRIKYDKIGRNITGKIREGKTMDSSQQQKVDNQNSDNQNPAIALEKYWKDVDAFAEKKAENAILEGELATKQQELDSQNSELNNLQNKLASMGEFKQGNIEGAIQNLKITAQKKIDLEIKNFQIKQNEFSSRAGYDIQANDDWLRNRMQQLLGDGVGVNRELTENEKQALQFEIARRQYITASNERINQCEDAITEEQLGCQTVVGELRRKQDGIYAKYEPDISKYKNEVDGIYAKYEPDIRQCQDVVSVKVANRDEEIGQLQAEKNRDIQLANNEIEGYKKQIKQTEKQYNEQIFKAKLKNSPVVRIQNSKMSRINALNDEIRKTTNRLNKKISSVDQKIDVAQNKHMKQIEKADNQLQSVIYCRDQELQEPLGIYEGFVQDRDNQVAVLQSEINQRENESKSKIAQYQQNIEAERQGQNYNNAMVDQQITEYVMNGNTCFMNVLYEQYAPFIALQGRSDRWMDLLCCIEKYKSYSNYEPEYEKQKGVLATKEYSELQGELANAMQYKDEISVFARNNRVLTIAGGVLAGIGLILMIVLCAVLKIAAGKAGIAAIILGLAVMCFTIIKTKSEFSQICRYIALAFGYQEYPSITSYATMLTQNYETTRMKESGVKLYNVYYGRTEAQNIHDAKDADIRADYERNVKLAEKNYENNVAQIERERDIQIKRISADAISAESNFYNQKEDLQSQVKKLTVTTDRLASNVSEIEKKVGDNAEFLEKFESGYLNFVKQLSNENWITPMNYTHGKLSDLLYIIPENGMVDHYNHKKIYKIQHNKKALVFNYDISCVEDGRIEQVNKIILGLLFDLMYAVYRMNSKETYVQFVVDGMGAANDLKNVNVKNAFNIKEVVGKIEDIKGRIKEITIQREKIAEKGTTMDALNEGKFKSQDRPGTYNILYIIYRPEEKKSGLERDIRDLLPECDKYGFFPIFICEKNTWESETGEEKASMYKEIKGFTNGETITYDGKTYVIA